MGEITKIEWCDHTFNPWIGCERISPACDHCYAAADNARYGRPELWQGKRRRTAVANWKKPLKWNRAAQGVGQRARVFCASWADVFDNQVPPEWRADLWQLIAECQHLDWLLLTKRPQNIRKMLPPGGWPYPNVWLGTTTENQEEFDRRWRHLKAVPARVHFISYEPALGPLRLPVSDGPDWVIAGGESGFSGRPPNPEWFGYVRDQCATAGAAFFFKQWGVPKFNPLAADCPPDERLTQFIARVDPNGKGGALLDSRLWREFPQ